MWYRTGTVALTNGSATVTGSGTAFIANVSIGEAFLGPDGRAYEITDIPSNTSLTISPAYLGSTASGQSYAILPARGRIADLIAETQSLLASFATVRDGIGSGLFPDGTAAAPGLRFTNDQDTGILRVGSNILGIATAGALRALIDGSGNVGIGTASPQQKLDVAGNLRLSGSLFQRLQFNRAGIGDWYIGGSGLEDNTFNIILNAMRVVTLDTGGNVGIGTTVPTALLHLLGPGSTGTQVQSSSPSGICFVKLRNATADWNIEVGRENANAGFGVYNNAVGSVLVIQSDSTVRAGADNAQNLGSASIRWATVYAGTGTINTSDEREKHWRGELNAAELRAAKRIIGELGIYQWNDAVAEKGEDGARLHFGVRAQRAFAIMEDEGLDWERYAWACYDQWEEQTEPVMEEVTVTKTRKVMRPSTLIDPATGQPAMVEVDEAYEETEMRPTGETRVTLEAGDRYGVRPDQLAFWLIAAQAAVQADLEARITMLETA